MEATLHQTRAALRWNNTHLTTLKLTRQVKTMDGVKKKTRARAGRDSRADVEKRRAIHRRCSNSVQDFPRHQASSAASRTSAWPEQMSSIKLSSSADGCSVMVCCSMLPLPFGQQFDEFGQDAIAIVARKGNR